VHDLEREAVFGLAGDSIHDFLLLVKKSYLSLSCNAIVTERGWRDLWDKHRSVSGIQHSLAQGQG
jgi:hypothetical protein